MGPKQHFNKKLDKLVYEGLSCTCWKWRRFLLGAYQPSIPSLLDSGFYPKADRRSASSNGSGGIFRLSGAFCVGSAAIFRRKLTPGVDFGAKTTFQQKT